MAAHVERQRDDHDRDAILAYQVVRIYVETMNKKQMPALDTLLTKRAEDGPTAKVAGHLAQLQSIAAQTGLPLMKRLNVKVVRGE